MPSSREGTATVIFSKDNLYKLERAQREAIQKGIYDENTNTLTSALGGFLTVLGFIVTKAPTPVGVAVSVVSVGVSLVPSLKDRLDSMSNNGLNWIRSQYDFMYDNPQFDLIEITYPYLEYYNVDGNKEVRFVTGKGILKRVHTSGGWMIA